MTPAITSCNTLRNEPKMQPADYHLQYMHGFSDAAARRAIDPAREQHADAKMRQAYAKGYLKGKAAARAAQTRATMLYGYKPSILCTKAA
jgi:hypothetical protein